MMRDETVSIRIRLYRIVCLAVSLLFFLIVLPTTMLQDLPFLLDIVILFFALASLLFCRRSCCGHDHLRSYYWLILLVLNLTWFLNGGSTGSLNFFFLAAAIYPVVFFRGATRWLMFMLLLADNCVLLFVEHTMPSLVIPFHDQTDRILDLSTGFVTCAIIIVVVLWVVVNGYEHALEERNLVERSLQQAQENLELQINLRTAELASTIACLQEEIAERIKTGEELREKDRLLLHQSRFAAMGEMVNNIAHQWRQPLNVLGLLIQQLPLLHENQMLQQEGLEKTAREAMKLVHHMSKTIDDFRHFFKPHTEKLSFNVAGAINEIISLIGASLRHSGIETVVKADNDLVVRGYPNEFSQVFLNLIQNARDAFAEKGITEPVLSISAVRESACVVITVADNAGGIPENVIGNIFDPYFSTKGAQGTGIGLYMSKNIIEKNMGGQISVRNLADGAEFSITLDQVGAMPPHALNASQGHYDDAAGSSEQQGAQLPIPW